jgi:predicted XRE-type DNA-binding protein
MTTTHNDHLLELDLMRFAPLFKAYLECGDELRGHATELFATLADPELTPDERVLTASTLADILFPRGDDCGRLQGAPGVDLEEAEQQRAEHRPKVRQAVEAKDQEEATFADRLRALMEERQLTQAQLAEKIGVGQSAISMMLNRQCRPQRRTIDKLAAALEVPPDELWPVPRQR